MGGGGDLSQKSQNIYPKKAVLKNAKIIPPKYFSNGKLFLGGILKINPVKGKKNFSLCQKAQRLAICDKF